MITASSGVPVPCWIANGKAALQGKQLVVVEQETAGRAGM